MSQREQTASLLFSCPPLDGLQRYRLSLQFFLLNSTQMFPFMTSITLRATPTAWCVWWGWGEQGEALGSLSSFLGMTWPSFIQSTWKARDLSRASPIFLLNQPPWELVNVRLAKWKWEVLGCRILEH